MDIRVVRSTAAFFIALSLSLLAAGSSQAQAPAPDSPTSTQAPTPPVTSDNSSPAAEAQRQGAQPFNNAPVWREVRSGGPQTTTITGRETNILIQPQGQTWRTLRNSDISVFGGWALVALFLAIGTFYRVKGNAGAA